MTRTPVAARNVADPFYETQCIFITQSIPEKFSEPALFTVHYHQQNCCQVSISIFTAGAMNMPRAVPISPIQLVKLTAPVYFANEANSFTKVDLKLILVVIY